MITKLRIQLISTISNEMLYSSNEDCSRSRVGCDTPITIILIIFEYLYCYLKLLLSLAIFSLITGIFRYERLAKLLVTASVC